MLHPYRSIDLYPEKIGVNTIISGYVLRFKPWYYDGKSVYWGDNFDLRSEAEDAAYQLKSQSCSTSGGLSVKQFSIFDAN